MIGLAALWSGDCRRYRCREFGASCCWFTFRVFPVSSRFRFADLIEALFRKELFNYTKTKNYKRDQAMSYRRILVGDINVGRSKQSYLIIGIYWLNSDQKMLANPVCAFSPKKSKYSDSRIGCKS